MPRKLSVPMQVYTKQERKDRLNQAAAILEAAGIVLEGKGYTGIVNDVAEHLPLYVSARLREAGHSESYIKAVLSALKK